MSAEIKYIIERRWTYPGERKTSWSHTVYYASGKRVQYSHNKNLPNNILHYILEADSTEVSYTEGYNRNSTFTIKKIKYTKTEQDPPAKPKATRKQPDRTYSVTFTTQRHRVESHWEFITTAPNRDTAREAAESAWYKSNDPHMFHVEAKRIDSIPEGREPGTFKVLSARGVTWGYRR